MPDRVEPSFGRTPEIISYLEDLVGIPYPWNKYSQVMIDEFMYGGMENTTATTLNDFALVDKQGLIDYNPEGLIAHEAAHQWFGDLVTNRSWDHLWLHESFATYLAARWTEHSEGEEAYLAQIRGYVAGGINTDKELGRSPIAGGKGYTPNIYGRGAVVLHMLNKLVGDLFELSKLDARQIEPQVEPFNMAELTQDVVMKFQPLAGEMGVALTADLPKDLPNVRGDLALIERALSNLIENAVRYTPGNGSVCVRLENTNHAVYVFVSDTGPGIPAEDLSRIFERFYRLEKSRTSRHGAGLGLAIAQKIIELHNSRIKVESVVNEGTTFSFVLPAVLSSY